MKLAVLGAGGFVGSTLCERLFFEKEHDFVPVVHSYSGAARLARLPIRFQTADVLNEARVHDAIKGCDAIVNLSRGDAMVMTRGVETIIKAARATGIKRIVHVSSIAIYGSNPPPESCDESAEPCPDDDYGLWKVGQDELLLKAQDSGLQVILLCPANIYGPYSAFITAAAQHLRRGMIALVDGGTNPTNHVHVNNVVEAILVAVRSETGWGQRYFVNEVERTTWAQFYADLGAAIGVTERLESIPKSELSLPGRTSPVRTGVLNQLKILGSGDFRKGLAVLPAFASLNNWAYKQFGRLDPQLQERLRNKMARPTIIVKQAPSSRFDNRYVREQAKSVYHSPARIMRTLGFQPFSYRQGMETVRQWLEFTADA